MIRSPLNRARKPKDCAICEETFIPTMRNAAACSVDCALKLHYRQEKRKAQKKFDAETRRRRKASRKKSDYIKEAQKEFNRYIRLRDREEPCVSCGTFKLKYGQVWDCGHYQPTSTHAELRFNPYNAHRQCSGCNRGGEQWGRKGATVRDGYRISLIDRIGLNVVEKLEGPRVLKQYEVDELVQIRKTFKDLADGQQRLANR